MIGFIIKKAFFDTWDNLIRFIVFNFMTLPFLILAYWGLKLVALGGFIGFVVILIALMGLVVHQGTIFYFLRDIGNSHAVSLKDYLKYLRLDLKIKIQFAAAWAIFITVTSFSIVYYLNGNGVISLIPLP
ncbi:hypothetical protein EW093_15595 [Thiospirochaeta perfilievii]|uniref:Uncharacterized protein n=1 Tax=Thiospirochaeta perfilievii TaxID=252967 RepID=A0A5C1QIH9_9SPIO|nr:hypothetical protein [Thiospirochaeta perfilievii]QEN06052.1 hypothetical protein EW093_15595 [Thiospirochaeta perfilievii]